MIDADRDEFAHARLSHMIRETVVREIVSGELEPGTRLVETKLAARFGTSQAPVREALRELDSFGLVEIRPRRGTFVGAFVQQTFRESYIVRAALEETAARLVLTDDTLPVGPLREDVERMRHASRNDDVDSLAAATVTYHRRIMAAAGNDLLLRSWESLHIEARTSATLMVARPDLHAIAESHEALTTALVDSDVELACRAAREHQWHYARLADDR